MWCHNCSCSWAAWKISLNTVDTATHNNIVFHIKLLNFLFYAAITNHLPFIAEQTLLLLELVSFLWERQYCTCFMKEHRVKCQFFFNISKPKYLLKHDNTIFTIYTFLELFLRNSILFCSFFNNHSFIYSSSSQKDEAVYAAKIVFLEYLHRVNVTVNLLFVLSHSLV